MNGGNVGGISDFLQLFGHNLNQNIGYISKVVKMQDCDKYLHKFDGNHFNRLTLSSLKAYVTRTLKKEDRTAALYTNKPIYCITLNSTRATYRAQAQAHQSELSQSMACLVALQWVKQISLGWTQFLLQLVVRKKMHDDVVFIYFN